MTFAQLLNRLFETIHAPDRGPYTNAEVVALLDWAITPQYISKLRNGQSTNPTMEVIEGLARVFNVPPAYFFDTDLSAKILEELEFLASLRDAGVKELALRAAELTPDGRAAVRSVMEHIRSVEQRDADGSPQAGA
jgi:transcriptional regulator with XRE-family HTH domain